MRNVLIKLADGEYKELAKVKSGRGISWKGFLFKGLEAIKLEERCEIENLKDFFSPDERRNEIKSLGFVTEERVKQIVNEMTKRG